jgi:hypothetical protein
MHPENMTDKAIRKEISNLEKSLAEKDFGTITSAFLFCRNGNSDSKRENICPRLLELRFEVNRRSRAPAQPVEGE